jgi:hypothetical protein
MQGTNQAGTVIAERTYGTLTLSLTTAIGGFTVAARSGMIRHDELTKGFENKDAAREFWGRVAYLAQAQMSAAQIIEKLTADSSYEWNAPAPVEPAARIADIYGVRRTQVRPTMAGAHLTPLSAPQQAALQTAVNGQVSLQPGISRPTLRALVRKGYGEAIWQAGLGRRQVIEAVRLFTGSTAVAA